MTAPIVVGFGHYARVGKDTAAEILVRDHGFRHVSFAGVLKDLAQDLDPWLFNGRESNPDSLNDLVVQYGWDVAKVRFPAVRAYLVHLGNSCRIQLGEDVWVDALFGCFEEGGRYVISDVRYPNEARAISDAMGVNIKIVRPGVEPGDNVADHALDDYTGWDYTINNAGSIEVLAQSLGYIMEKAL